MEGHQSYGPHAQVGRDMPSRPPCYSNRGICRVVWCVVGAGQQPIITAPCGLQLLYLLVLCSSLCVNPLCLSYNRVCRVQVSSGFRAGFIYMVFYYIGKTTKYICKRTKLTNRHLRSRSSLLYIHKTYYHIKYIQLCYICKRKHNLQTYIQWSSNNTYEINHIYIQ